MTVFTSASIAELLGIFCAVTRAVSAMSMRQKDMVLTGTSLVPPTTILEFTYRTWKKLLIGINCGTDRGLAHLYIFLATFRQRAVQMQQTKLSAANPRADL